MIPFSASTSIRTRSRSFLRSSGSSDLVCHLCQHQTQLFVPLDDPHPHPFHRAGEPSELVASLVGDTLVPPPPLDAKRSAREPLQRPDNSGRQGRGEHAEYDRRPDGPENEGPPELRQRGEVVGSHQHDEHDVALLQLLEPVLVEPTVLSRKQGRYRLAFCPGRLQLGTVAIDLADRCTDRGDVRGIGAHEERVVAANQIRGIHVPEKA
jgi:hypothetical protein